MTDATTERRRMLALCVAECEQIEREFRDSQLTEYANGAFACATAIRRLMGEDGGRRIIVLAPDDGTSEMDDRRLDDDLDTFLTEGFATGEIDPREEDVDVRLQSLQDRYGDRVNRDAFCAALAETMPDFTGARAEMRLWRFLDQYLRHQGGRR